MGQVSFGVGRSAHSASFPPPLSLPHEPRVPRQSEDELREFIHQTVELASTLLEQTAALKKKAGGGKSFSPYV